METVNLAWGNKIAVIGYTWLFVYESSLTYKGRLNASPSQTYVNDGEIMFEILPDDALPLKAF